MVDSIQTRTDIAHGSDPVHTPSDLSPDTLSDWLNDDRAVLVDVREDFEHAEERIEGAVLAPLSRFDADAIRAVAGDRVVVFHCRSGKRSAEAVKRFGGSARGACCLAGGIEAWQAAGKPVQKPTGTRRLPIMRQVQVAAGSMVAIGVGLGVTVSPWFLALPAFVGCGLVFAGMTGWCGMALLLAKMPWNRAVGSGDSCAVSSPPIDSTTNTERRIR